MSSSATSQSSNPASPSSASASHFASVKLSALLVDQARSAAQPLRRSVAGQLEYWAILGRIVEQSGLTVQEARAAIEGYEALHQAPASTAQATDQVVALVGQFKTLEKTGNLAQRVREVVASNRLKQVARPPAKARALAA